MEQRMQPGLVLSKIWSDEDMVELRVQVSDGTSLFSNNVYVGHAALAEAVSSLDTFKRQVHGGLFDLRFGAFGPDYANGAFQARFLLLDPGRLFVSCEQESDFDEFARTRVASRATLYLKSEPGLLDKFVEEMRDLSCGRSTEARLQAI